MDYLVRAVIIACSVIQIAYGALSAYGSIRRLEALGPCLLTAPLLMILTGGAGLVVQLPRASPALRPVVIAGDILCILAGGCGVCFVFRAMPDYADLGSIVFWLVMVGGGTVLPGLGSIVGITNLPPRHHHDLYG